MTRKKAVAIASINEIDAKVNELKLELAKEKGMLASKTKSTNPSKKKTLKKQIARLLTKKNQLLKIEEKKLNSIKKEVK